jgi:predicted alpha/beta-hydrolase family hydrolase
MKALLTLAHGAGAGMHHAFMTSLADELATLGIGTIRFNFPFTEHKKKRPDSPVVAHQTIAAVIEFAKQHYTSTPLFVSGKSFGGRMSSQLLSSTKIEDVKGIIFFGFPLHPAGKPSTERAVHLHTVKLPMLFLQGTRDTLAEWNLIEKVCGELSSATLIKFEGADHSFKMSKQNAITLLAHAAHDWIADHISRQ